MVKKSSNTERNSEENQCKEGTGAVRANADCDREQLSQG